MQDSSVPQLRHTVVVQEVFKKDEVLVEQDRLLPGKQLHVNHPRAAFLPLQRLACACARTLGPAVSIARCLCRAFWQRARQAALRPLRALRTSCLPRGLGRRRCSGRGVAAVAGRVGPVILLFAQQRRSERSGGGGGGGTATRRRRSKRNSGLANQPASGTWPGTSLPSRRHSPRAPSARRSRARRSAAPTAAGPHPPRSAGTRRSPRAPAAASSARTPPREDAATAVAVAQRRRTGGAGPAARTIRTPITSAEPHAHGLRLPSEPGTQKGTS